MPTAVHRHCCRTTASSGLAVRPGAKRFHHNRVAFAELTHVQLTKGFRLAVAMGDAVGHGPAGAADALPAVIIEFNRLLVFQNQFFI